MRCLNCRRDGISLKTEICPKCGVYLPSLLRDVLPNGTILKDTYRIDYALGRGGFGITYRAMHMRLEKIVAIKEFYPREHALREGRTGTLITPTDKEEVYQRNLQRFLREGTTLARLNHPNIVQVLDYCEARNTAYLVMELIRGKTLQDEINEQANKKLPETKVKELISTLVNALTAIHQQETYHLDIKPENILITPENRLVLVDFGASRQGLGTESTQAYTPSYAPPEVMSGKEAMSENKIGAYSDLFELGMMLHEMLTGKLPPNVFERLINDTWSAVELNEPWRGLVESAIKIKPELRPSSVENWWNRLLEFETRERRKQEQARQRREEEERRKQQEERNRREEEAQQQQRIEEGRRQEEAQRIREAEERRRQQEAQRIREAEERKKQEETRRKREKGTTTSHMTREKFLKYAGWAVFGGIGVTLIGIGISNDYSSEDSTESETSIQSSEESTESEQLAPLEESVNLAQYQFDVITVNNKGEEIKREQGTAEYFTEDLGNGITLDMVEIPGGTFTMGSPGNEKDRGDDESPQHQVTVAPFYMGKFAVTQAQWQKIMGNNPSKFKDNPNNPVENISWDDAVKFCNKLKEITGKEYRLPSEAEWEYACRAGTTTPFHFGETITSELANYNALNPVFGSPTYANEPKGKYREKTTPVGSFPPNSFGLYDMHGNVWEWCADTYHDNYNGAPTDGSAWVDKASNTFVLRGGSWYDYPRGCRCANRLRYARDLIYYIQGFRVVAPRTT